MHKRLKCSVCGNKALNFLVNVQYAYMLWVDTVCVDCFKWMDNIMCNGGARKYQPYTCNNPYIIYYEDRHIHQLCKERV